MHLRTLARDCLYLNWALPRDAAPAVAPPLRPEVHSCGGEDWVFVSLLIFRLDGLHLTSLPRLKLSYPQANLRLYVLDQDDVPSVLFLRSWVPFWVLPAVRLVGRQPARAAWLVLPPPSAGKPAGRWRWSIRRRGAVQIEAELKSPVVGPGPKLGSWEETVAHFRQRPRGYVQRAAGVQAVTTAHPPVPAWPLKARVDAAALVASLAPAVPEEHWLTPHSAWLCPEIPFRFELGKLPHQRLARRGVPATEGA
ncbi:MAG: hypothetical protein D6696_07580 [Acidobacteria bacterium]|nr:MAG: hypothetical protein D6696_07580 [Acidobacteriota bacterium]